MSESKQKSNVTDEDLEIFDALVKLAEKHGLPAPDRYGLAVGPLVSRSIAILAAELGVDLRKAAQESVKQKSMTND